jgi:hypothetical protein
MPGHLLRRCQQNAVEIFAQEVGEDGLTPRQFALLLTVHQRPGLMQTELVRLTGIDRSTLAEMTRRLAALRTALPGVIRAQERILAPLEGARRGLFLECLDAVAGPSPEGGEEDGSD